MRIIEGVALNFAEKDTTPSTTFRRCPRLGKLINYEQRKYDEQEK
jgi:hypothetical protein